MLRGHRSFAFRLVCIFASAALAVSSSANGIYSLSLATWQEIASQLQTRTGAFTDTPTEIYLGDNPSRDEDRRGMWTTEQLAAFRQQEAQEQAESGIGNASVKGRTALFATVGTGGGETMPWEGRLGSVNTNTGNKLTQLPIVSWPIRGGGAIDFTLSHSSKSTRTTPAGYAWVMSYDVNVAQTVNDLTEQITGANVSWDDGTIIPYGYTATLNRYNAPAGVYDTLVQNSNGTWTLTMKDQTKWNFDVNGRSVSWQDRAGNTVTIGRNTAGRITQITDPTSRQLSITYDTSNRISTITDPTSRVWTISHNTGGDITDVAMPSLGGTIYHRTYGYDTGHNITSMVDLRGKTWTWGYDSNDSLTTETNPLSQTTSYAYTSSACTMTLPGGQTSTDNYSSGMIASRVDAASYSTAYSSYDSNHNPQTTTDKRGKVWQYTYDSKANVLTKKDPLLHTWTYTYSTANDLLTSKDPLNNTTTITYNGTGGVLTITDPLSRVVETNTYDTNGQRLTTKNAMNEQGSFGYNTNGDRTSLTNPLGKQVTTVYDTLGRPTTVTDPLSHATSTSYDAWGRLTMVSFPESVSSSSTYDREGHLTSQLDENGHSISCTYDDAGNLTSATNALSNVESYGYNSNGWRTSVTNGRGYTRNYTYTVRGEVYTLTLPDSSVETWSYNGNGDTSSYVNPLNQAINYTFDDAGRNTVIDYPSGTNTSFGYDNVNRRTSMVDSTGTSTWTYNNGSEVTQLSTPQGTISYTLQTSGRRATMVETGVGTTTYGYDSGGRLISLQNPLNETTTFAYDDADRLTTKTLANGSYSEYAYDVRNRVTSINHKKSDTSVISSESYSYDSASNLSSKTVDGLTTTYTYDDDNQLITESRTGYVASYSYDANGNRASKTLNGVTDTYTVDSSDKLTGIALGGGGTKSYGYDQAGRTTTVTTSAGTTTLGYDYEGRLTSITYPDLSTNSFAYNGLDARTSMTDSSGSHSYKRDGVEVTDPVLSDGSASYTPGISEHRGSSTYYAYQDQLGSESLMTDSSQTVTYTSVLDAFGMRLSSVGSSDRPFEFGGRVGYQTDEDSLLMLLGHRYYDASTGRFLTRDPQKEGNNWYSYAQNRPTVYLDPSGYGIHPSNAHNDLKKTKDRFTIYIIGEKGEEKKWYGAVLKPGQNALALDKWSDVDYVGIKDKKTGNFYVYKLQLHADVHFVDDEWPDWPMPHWINKGFVLSQVIWLKMDSSNRPGRGGKNYGEMKKFFSRLCNTKL